MVNRTPIVAQQWDAREAADSVCFEAMITPAAR